MSSFPKRKRRIFGIMLVCIGLISFVLYVAIGKADVPPESPLADPNYVIRPLNDASVPNSYKLPPSADYPVNQLNNGEEWLPTLLFYMAWDLLGLAIVLTVKDKMLTMMMSLYVVQSVVKDYPKILASIPFAYSHLRAGAQPLIDNSHRWRVIFAHIMLWCENHHGRYAYHYVGWVFGIVMLVSFVLAFTIEYFGWTRREKLAQRLDV